MNWNKVPKEKKKPKVYPCRTGKAINGCVKEESYKTFAAIRDKKRFTNKEMLEWMINKVSK